MLYRTAVIPARACGFHSGSSEGTTVNAKPYTSQGFGFRVYVSRLRLHLFQSENLSFLHARALGFSRCACEGRLQYLSLAHVDHMLTEIIVAAS